MKRIGIVAAAVAAVGLAGATWAQGQGPWIHVRVEEPGKDTRVHVNLPLSVVEAALAMAPEKVVSDGKFHLGHEKHDLKVAEMRKLWNELKAAGDAEFVSVKERDETVSVRRAGDKVRVDVDKPSQKETVRIEVPLSLVDALFAKDSPELDLKQAIAELQKLRGDIVKVEGRDGTVRIWIDDRN